MVASDQKAENKEQKTQAEEDRPEGQNDVSDICKVLRLEGIEKAERNVLPLLSLASTGTQVISSKIYSGPCARPRNNLLENREMSLEDRPEL